MFGSRKKKLLKRMDSLVSMAQLAVFYSLNEKYEQHLSSDDASLFAAAISNQLFGRTSDPSHIERFTEEKIDREAADLLEDDTVLRDLLFKVYACSM